MRSSFAMRYGARVRRAAHLLLGVLLVVTSACTTFRAADGSGANLQQRIAAERLLEPGDRVRLSTASGEVREFRVASVDREASAVLGRRESVPITDITALEKRERSWVKTGVLVGLLALAIFDSDCEDDPACDLGYGGFCC